MEEQSREQTSPAAETTESAHTDSDSTMGMQDMQSGSASGSLGAEKGGMQADESSSSGLHLAPGAAEPVETPPVPASYVDLLATTTPDMETPAVPDLTMRVPPGAHYSGPVTPTGVPEIVPPPVAPQSQASPKDLKRSYKAHMQNLKDEYDQRRKQARQEYKQAARIAGDTGGAKQKKKGKNKK